MVYPVVRVVSIASMFEVVEMIDEIVGRVPP